VENRVIDTRPIVSDDAPAACSISTHTGITPNVSKVKLEGTNMPECLTRIPASPLEFFTWTQITQIKVRNRMGSSSCK
jgi:hypothetical protein